jgi:hypothetical protein
MDWSSSGSKEGNWGGNGSGEQQQLFTDLEVVFSKEKGGNNSQTAKTKQVVIDVIHQKYFAIVNEYALRVVGLLDVAKTQHKKPIKPLLSTISTSLNTLASVHLPTLYDHLSSLPNAFIHLIGGFRSLLVLFYETCNTIDNYVIHATSHNSYLRFDNNSTPLMCSVVNACTTNYLFISRFVSQLQYFNDLTVLLEHITTTCTKLSTLFHNSQKSSTPFLPLNVFQERFPEDCTNFINNEFNKKFYNIAYENNPNLKDFARKIKGFPYYLLFLLFNHLLIYLTPAVFCASWKMLEVTNKNPQGLTENTSIDVSSESNEIIIDDEGDHDDVGLSYNATRVLALMSPLHNNILYKHSLFSSYLVHYYLNPSRANRKVYLGSVYVF